MKEVKLIQLIRYTMYQSLIDNNVARDTRVVGNICSAQELLEAIE